MESVGLTTPVVFDSGSLGDSVGNYVLEEKGKKAYLFV